MRALFLLLALLVGIAAALLTQGRMAHLRLIAADWLPGWSAGIAADASLLSGRARFDPLNLAWQARWPDGGGPVWHLHLTGPGTTIAAPLRVSWRGDVARIAGASGQIDLAALALPVDGIIGLVDIAAIDATITRRPDSALPRIAAAATGAVLGAALRGGELGSGPVTAQLDPIGSWRIGADLDGPPGTTSVQLSGRLGLPHMGLDLRIPDGPGLPEEWRRLLHLGGDLKEGVWTLRRKLPLGG
jgi:hypothetical protein